MDPKETNWYVLYTFPRAEKQVKERLEREGIDCWLPLHRSPRVWSDRVKLVDVPLFNSYIFVHCAEGLVKEDASLFNYAEFKEKQYDKLADHVRAHVDMDAIYRSLTE